MKNMFFILGSFICGWIVSYIQNDPKFRRK